MSFKDFLNRAISKKHPKKLFKDVDPLFIYESMDSYFKILKQEELSKSVTLYYFDIESNKYRIFMENMDNHYHVGFERYFEEIDDWDIRGITKDLTSKDVLRIFGSIKKILHEKAFYSISVATGENKKHGVYRRVMQKMLSELNREGYDFNLDITGDFIAIYSDLGYKPKQQKFKYKVK